jgi:hypothetical protein
LVEVEESREHISRSPIGILDDIRRRGTEKGFSRVRYRIPSSKVDRQTEAKEKADSEPQGAKVSER